MARRPGELLKGLVDVFRLKTFFCEDVQEQVCLAMKQACDQVTMHPIEATCCDRPQMLPKGLGHQCPLRAVIEPDILLQGVEFPLLQLGFRADNWSTN